MRILQSRHTAQLAELQDLHSVQLEELQAQMQAAAKTAQAAYDELQQQFMCLKQVTISIMIGIGAQSSK